MDAAGIANAVNVNYKGTAPLLTDAIGGHLTMGVVAVASALSHHRAGTLRVLNVGSAERFRALPQVPTLRESGFNIAADTWYGLMVQKDTPPHVVQAIVDAVKAVSKDPQLLATIEKNGGEALFSDSETFAQHVRKEAQELNELVQRYPPDRD
jgi:tripartite-type tricarboxylate transporter receptor subunit TctC